MSGNWREIATMSSGWLNAGSKFTSGSPLWATKTLTPRSWACWTVGRPMAGSSNENPWAVGLQAVYTLNADGGPDCTALDISSSVAPRGPTFGAMMFSTNSRLAPPWASPAVICWVLRASGKGIGRVRRPRVGDVGQHGHGGIAGQEQVVQVRGAIDAVELAGCRCSLAGSMPRTRPTVSGAFWTQGPLGITWWVCTSKMNSPLPASAC